MSDHRDKSDIWVFVIYFAISIGIGDALKPDGGALLGFLGGIGFILFCVLLGAIIGGISNNSGPPSHTPDPPSHGGF